MANEEKNSAALTRGYRKTRRGYVTSDKMDKTIVVEVEDRVKHALYGKIIRRTSKVKAHDELGTAGVGDLQAGFLLNHCCLLFRSRPRPTWPSRGSRPGASAWTR